MEPESRFAVFLKTTSKSYLTSEVSLLQVLLCCVVVCCKMMAEKLWVQPVGTMKT